MNARPTKWYHFGWLENPKLQGIANLATALGALLAFLALAFGAYQLKLSADQNLEQSLLQREMAANASWERYMELASARPLDAVGRDFPSLSPVEQTSYFWFVERMLFAGEQILGFDPHDPQWRLTIAIEARQHASYLGSPQFLDESLCTFTVRLRQTLIEAFSATNRALASQLRARHNRCLAEGYNE